MNLQATSVKKRSLKKFIGSCQHLLYHLLLVALSAGIAFSLPTTVSFVARNVLVCWSLIENEKIFLLFVEVALAILLILLLNYIGGSWKNRKLSRMAKSTGMVRLFHSRGLLADRSIKRLKKRQGFARDVMVISSTGFRTFADQTGDLHSVLKNCREAKIMLLDPYSEGARARAKSLLDPNISPENFTGQIRKSIEFLKKLRAGQKEIRLKLYRDMPFLKLAILGDYLWMKHYHPGLHVEEMPEYLFEHDQNPGGLYTPLYQYFLSRWGDPHIPEYDLDTDELVTRDQAGNEITRRKFGEGLAEAN